MSANDLFDEDGEIRLLPRDGYRVSVHQSADGWVSLQVGLWIEGKLQEDERCFWVCKEPTDAELGELDRVRELARAICRFLNTGGSWQPGTVRETSGIYGLLANLFVICPHGLNLPREWYLYDSRLNDEGRYEHLFRRQDSNNVIRWVEGAFVDSLLLPNIQKDLEEAPG